MSSVPTPSIALTNSLQAPPPQLRQSLASKVLSTASVWHLRFSVPHRCLPCHMVSLRVLRPTWTNLSKKVQMDKALLMTSVLEILNSHTKANL